MATGCKDKGPIGEGVAMVNVPITEMDGAADFLRSGAKNKGAVGAGDRAQSSASGAGVENLMSRLRLTTAESTAVIIGDVDDLEMVDPNRASVGKVNMRYCSSSFDADISTVDVVFDRLAIWARITKLSTRLMRAARGIEIAKPIGNVIRVEADDLGRCWGPYMRIRVEVDVQKPLLRYVTVISSRLQSSATYEVKYERLPLYCFSCGLLGHSALGCANPADRDENRDIPYFAKRLSVDDGLKTSGGSHSGSFASPRSSHVPGSRGTAGSLARGGRDGGRGAGQGQRDTQEVSSSQRGGIGRGRGRASRGQGRGMVDCHDLPIANPMKNTVGLKRKAPKVQPAAPLLLEDNPERAVVLVFASFISKFWLCP
ncbi:hypothetical protein D1007_33639 [Hordeum vulgare]|nr:hypothetical protein D1007_33639 [Hordeum vulgare]